MNIYISLNALENALFDEGSGLHKILNKLPGSCTVYAGVWYQASIVNTRCGHAAMLVRTFPFLSPDGRLHGKRFVPAKIWGQLGDKNENSKILLI